MRGITSIKFVHADGKTSNPIAYFHHHSPTIVYPSSRLDRGHRYRNRSGTRNQPGYVVMHHCCTVRQRMLRLFEKEATP